MGLKIKWFSATGNAFFFVASVVGFPFVANFKARTIKKDLKKAVEKQLSRSGKFFIVLD